jgi:hypothetical protein
LRPRLAAGVPLLAVRLDDLPCFVSGPGVLEGLHCSLWSNFGRRRTPKGSNAEGPDASASGPPCCSSYLTSSKILKIGMYMATIIEPTMAPRPAIIRGSMSAVRDSVVASTSWS